MPRINARAAPATAEELLSHLARVRLIDDEQRRRLGDDWSAGLTASDAAERLIAAGLLTPFQAEQALAGRARRLRMGPYCLLERLGAGSGGEVFKAEHVLMKRLVTLKLFARGVGRPRDEVAAAAKLSHPSLAAALHAGRVRGRLVLVLEFVDGIDLECLLQQTGPLPVDLVREVIRQAGGALAHLHGRGILHHDVKPANLLLAHEGSDARPVVKLIDLGLARPAGEGELGGTIDYLAPERGEGGPIDARSDLYSLGCTAYHLLTGQVPFAGGTWTEKLIRHRTEEPVSLSSLRPDVPRHFVGVISRLMARDAGRRYPDAAALLAEIDPPPEAIPVARPVPARRRRTWRPLARVVAALLVGACAGGAARVMLPAVALTRPGVERNVILVDGVERDFIDLQSAINATPDGGAVTISGSSLYRLAPVNCQGKALTIRAAEGTRVKIQREDVEAYAWDALVHGGRDVRLVGLDLSGGDQVAPLASVEGGSLTLSDCSLRAHGPGPLVTLRKGTALRIERCRLNAAAQAVAVEAGPTLTRVALRETSVKVRDVAGAAVLLWSEESAAGGVTLTLQRGEIDAGRVLALRGLSGRAAVDATSCKLTFLHALASVDCRGDWRAHLSWRGRDVTYAASGPFLRLDGEPLAWDETAWAKLNARP